MLIGRWTYCTLISSPSWIELFQPPDPIRMFARDHRSFRISYLLARAATKQRLLAVKHFLRSCEQYSHLIDPCFLTHSPSAPLRIHRMQKVECRRRPKSFRIGLPLAERATAWAVSLRADKIIEKSQKEMALWILSTGCSFCVCGIFYGGPKAAWLFLRDWCRG